MAHKTRTLKASELIEDFSIYPRNCVFDGHVYDLSETIRSGAALPPCVADAKTMRLTDGFHRRRAYIRVYGEDAPIETMLVEFSGDAEMVCDAVARNAIHGRRLTTADIARCASLGKQFRISRERMAELLHITRDKLTEITAERFATGKAGTVVLRRPMAHLAGRKLTKAQEEVSAHVGGQTALYHVNTLIKLIESKSLPDDDKLIDRLRQLHEHLEGLLVA
jgi:hypothetical protein